MRFVHADGWFADLPDGTDTSDLRHLTLVEGLVDNEAVPIVMRGLVIARRHGWNVVSCHGLYVSGPGSHAVGTHVTALLGSTVPLG